MALPVTLTNGPSWVDVGILITQVLTVVAAAGAYFAIRRQIGDSERQHREQLHGGLRPVVTIEQAQIARTDRGSYVEVTARNVGPGPALDVELTGWVRRLPRRQMPGWEARPLMDEACARADLDAPEMRVRLGAIGVGERATEYMAIEPQLVDAPPTGDFLVYFATYRDVFENKFPSKPRGEWRPGHITFKQ